MAKFRFRNSSCRVKRLLILFGALLILIFFGSWIGLHFFVQGDSFRDWLAKKVSRSIRADGQFEPLTWEGSNFRSAGFSAIGNPKSKFRSLKITNISAHIDWRQLLKGHFVLDYVNAEKIEAEVGRGAAENPSPQPTHRPPAFKFADFLPSEVRIDHFYVADANLRWQTNRGDTGQYTGAKIRGGQGQPDLWDIEVIGGKVQHAAYPVIEIEGAHGTISRESIVIQDATGALAGGAAIEIKGNIAIARQLNAVLSADVTDIDTHTVLPPAWKVGGKMSGHLVYKGDLDRFEHGAVTGSGKISGAAIDLADVFGTLHQLAKFGGLNDVQLDSIASDVQYQDGNAHFSNFHASYQDQIRVEGEGSIGTNHIDANLLLGLSPKVLGWIPGAEERVFTDQKDGLRWTTVRISGTPEQPKEDLTKRLVAAFRDKMTKEFKGQAKDAIKSLLDMFHK
jgi:hypothetical protein